MVITLCFDVGIGQQEDGEDDGDDIPLREYQTLEESAIAVLVALR